MRGAHIHWTAALFVAVLCLGAPSLLEAQERACTRQRPRVDRLEITGNDAITDADLRSIMFTERAWRRRRWFGWNYGPVACLDSIELERDTRRIARWYDMRGYPGTTATVRREALEERTARVRFVVREAPPVLIDTVTLVNLPPRVLTARPFAAALEGLPLDDSVLVAAADSALQLLRAAGYARARPATRSATVDSVARRARVTFTFNPGNLVHIGDVAVDLTSNNPARPALSHAEIQQLLRFKPGDVYDARAIGASQQLLFSYDLYRTVAIDTIGGARALGDTVPVRVRLAEGRHSWLRAGGGWGTIDCFRTQARYTQQNFLGEGHRFQADLRFSKIGVGAPVDQFPGGCAPGVRADSFSTKLNYYGGLSLALRGPFGDRWHPQATLYSERRTEYQSYMRETEIGGLASFDKPLLPRVNTTFTYRFDIGRTFSDQAVACANFGLCRFNDRAILLSRSTTHAAGSTWSRSAPSITAFAANDERWAIEGRFGTVWVGNPSTTINFFRTQLEYALYRPLTKHLVGAARISGGLVATQRDLEPLVPPQERFFSGGQNTVRGYNQGQLGPVVYIVPRITDTVTVGGDDVGEADATAGFSRVSPAGGTATALLNLELRSRTGWPTDILRWVAFVDAGRVWNNSGNYAVTGLRVTPGLGVRLITPLGPFRVDVAYNPNGHEAGPAFYLQSASDVLLGRAICVSQGSTEPLDDAAYVAKGPTSCPATFRPPKPQGLWPRLTFHFSIGEAF